MPRVPLALAALLCLAAPGRSDWVTLHFDGVADFASGADLARLGLSQGTAVSGTVRYQSSSSLPEPMTNDVMSLSMPGSITVRAGGHSFPAAALGPPFPWLPDHRGDYMRAEIRVPGIPGGRTEDLESLSLSLNENSPGGGADYLVFAATFNRADVVPVGNLPTDPRPFVGGAGWFSLDIISLGPDGIDPTSTLRLHLAGAMIGVSATPEPGALALAGLGAGAGLLTWARRRYRGRVGKQNERR